MAPFSRVRVFLRIPLPLSILTLCYPVGPSRPWCPHCVLASASSENGEQLPPRWDYSPGSFRDYLRDVYFLSFYNSSHRIVYSKRGTTGIAGQMKGVCDSFLLALLKNYSFQCDGDGDA